MHTPPHLLVLILLILAALLLPACHAATPASHANNPPSPTTTKPPAPNPPKDATQLAPPPLPGEEVATFAGGCFWCMEGPFEQIDGVREVLSGYTGGQETGPTYKQVSSGLTTHTEAVHVYFDPQKVSYTTLLDAFWRSMDPTDSGGQFADRGTQYRPAIFTHSDAQRAQAEASKQALQQSKRFQKPIVVPILPASDFWAAETYHQDYYKKNPVPYQRYRDGSGRTQFLKKTWN